uniref:Uncharacterized protein n=1 Tax=Romanomermis culicivorax TaxID=13658 RepID=A0A915HXC2_ROMCU
MLRIPCPPEEAPLFHKSDDCGATGKEIAAPEMSNLLSIRNLVALLFCIVFFVLLYYYNESLDTLVTVERDKDKCQQNLDTLSAQLQGT